MKLWIFPCIALLAAGCSALPRDPEGTLERVRAEHRFKVGVIAAGQARVAARREQAFLKRVAVATGARPIPVLGAAEPLLEDLEHGRVDLVIGELAPDSPWVDRVTILPPMGVKVEGERRVVLSAMARNGENAWISLLEREARRISEPEASQ